MRTMPSLRALLYALSTGALYLFVGTGCGPTYPKCENDGHCEDKGEFCLNGLCQECRDNTHCTGAGMMCAAGKCQLRPGYCDDTVSCPGGGKCRDNQCGPECLGNDECTGNTYCSNGSCIEKPECGEGADVPECPDGKECVGGRCEVPVGQCSSEPVYFAFDRSNIQSKERAKLDALAQCMKGANPADLRIEGHADERGTAEYNLALGERRAESARRYLENLGVDSSKLSTVSFGKERPAVSGSNRAAWAKNRRAEFH